MMEPYGSSVFELLNGDEPVDRQLRELRTLLSRLATSVTARGTLTALELAEFNELIGSTPVRARLEALPHGGYLLWLEPLADDPVELEVRELAGEFGSMLRRDPTRIKLCDSCGNVYWDGTRSRTRRWCDSRTCG